MNRPLLADPVIYTAPTGERHAAFVAREPQDGSTERDLVVLWFNGNATFPMSAVRFSAIGTRGTWDFAAREIDGELLTVERDDDRK